MKLVGWLSVLIVLFNAQAFAAPKGKPVVFAGTLSLTGKYEAMGRERVKGLKIWERDVNSEGGLLGRPVVVEIVDDGSDPKRAADAYAGFISKKKVDFLLSPYSSGISAAIVDLVEKSGYPILTTASDDRLWEVPRRYFMGLFSTATRYFIGLIEMLATRKVASVAIVSFPDNFSKTCADGAKTWVQSFGMKVAFSAEVQREGGAAQLEAMGRSIRESGAGAVIVTGYLDDTVLAREAFVKAGLGDVLFAASIGPAMNEFSERLGPLADGAFGESMWEPNDRIVFPRSKKFIDDFRKLHGEPSSYHAAAAYAQGQLFADAVKKTGSLDREKVRDALSAGGFRSVLGLFQVKNGFQIGHRPLVIQWQKGRKEIVWPDETATAQPVFPR